MKLRPLSKMNASDDVIAAAAAISDVVIAIDNDEAEEEEDDGDGDEEEEEEEEDDDDDGVDGRRGVEDRGLDKIKTHFFFARGRRKRAISPPIVGSMGIVFTLTLQLLISIVQA